MADQEMQESQPAGVAIAPTLKNVQNIVSTVNWGHKLDLKAIGLRAPNTRIVTYKPKRIPFLVMKIREPKTTALISASGMMTGIMQKLGFPAKFEDFKIRSHMNVNFRKWLDGLVRSYGASSSLNLVDEVSKSIQQLTI